MIILVVTLGQEIRRSISSIKQNHQNLNSMYQQSAAKKRKKPADEKRVEAQRKVVELVGRHIEQCEALERNRYVERNKRAGASAEAGGRAGAASDSVVSRLVGKRNTRERVTVDELLPEIDGDLETQQAVLHEQDQNIDRKLEQIQDKLVRVKTQAQDIGDELRLQGQIVSNLNTQGQIVSNLNTQVSEVNEDLSRNNKNLREIKARMRSGDKFLMDIVLVIVLLGLMWYLYKVLF
ncbi:hypothetical protein KIPB_002953 [Kipferlia bialata]|uniref:t-SNARE coiled-coil homology domain-containing protein n=1 Tax=Kipferlia bialata TaxID=797122 RepID=A0A9K3GH27_9EUKA|nr:hypothetical protein KIPB_002953 [Kipferlia bialata]|eukprot:g2953.t1